MGVEPNEPIKIEIINSEPYCIQSGIYWSKASYLGNVVELYDGWTSGGVGGGLIYRSDSEPEIDLLELFGPESIYGCANKIESVWYYDHINDSWLSYGFDAPEFLNKLYTIETGKIYSIMPKEPCVLNYSGEGSFWKADYCEHGCESGECLVSVCVDVDQDGYDTCNIGDTGDDGKEIDCNDNNNLINSGKTEICGNGIDDNCDGSIDENCEGNCSADSDCDDNNSCTTDSCSNPGQWNSRCINIVEEQGVEICTNGIDDDCDGLIDYNDDDCKINAEGSKLSSKYSSKQAFLISDKNWQDVLPLIPAAVWTGNEDWCQRGYGTPENVCVNPVLIYHEEESGFDADSIIHFIQQYSPDNLTIAGDIPQDLSNLLISEREFGAGLLVEQIKQITTNDYFSYWENYNSIVYVENNYELALLASTYASLINAPLVIQGTINDTDSVFINKNVICVGNVARSCNENYNLEQLQQKYVDMTNTDKIILVNPNDLNIKVEENFTPNKSASINEIYSRTSLAASILASAKHELIISSPYSDNINVDSYLETKISELINAPLYLTILASPEAIQLNKMQERISGLNINIASDIYYYSNLNSDLFSELKTGRIFGISNADVSSLLARNIFYNSIEQSNNASSLYNNGGSNFKRKGKTNDNVLGGIGLNIQSQYLDELPEIRYDLSKLENQKVITYLDHGSPTGGYSITTYDLNNNDIRFSNSLFVSDSCMQCAYQEEKINLFCANVIRRGAVGFIGSLDETTHIDYVGRIADFQLGETIGSAIQEFSNERYLLGQMGGTYSYYSPFFYLGDPTLDLGLPKPNSTIISNYNNKKLDIYIPFDWETFHVYEYSQDRYYYITSGGKNLRDPNRSESGDNVRFYDKLFFHFTETDLVAVKDVYINGVLNGFNEEECLLVSSENCKMYEKNLGNFRIVLERLNDVYFVSIHFDQILPKTQIEVNNGINIEINFN
ncbi:putative metal-binding motif-containing protein [Candidatus Parcubacteria bacterium]|nr:putative metal-binding motif-containing protein [Candidatus Parcubacteria bacterium]